MKGCLTTLLIFILVCAAVLYYLSLADYYEGADWHCEAEEFRERYAEIIDNKITELQEKYGIECEKAIDPKYKTILAYYLYDDTFTIMLSFGERIDGFYSKLQAKLYYYGETESDLYDYSKQKHLVDFLEEIICYFGYDYTPNTFENFYNECIETGENPKYELIYEDDLIGDVSCSVGVDRILCDSYRAEKISDLEKHANYYKFLGLMKGTPS